MVYSRMFGRASDGRVPGRLQDPELHAPAVRGGCVLAGFVPVVSEYKVRRPQDEVRELIDGAAGTLAWFLTVVTIIA